MDHSVKTMIERTRSERCPERVLEKVHQSIADNRRATAVAYRLRIGLSLATAILVVGAIIYFL